MKGFTLVGYTDGTHTFELNKDYRVTTDNFSIVNNTVNLVSVWKENEYTRTHRDIDVINAMRIWMGLQTLTYDQLYAKEY